MSLILSCIFFLCLLTNYSQCDGSCGRVKILKIEVRMSVDAEKSYAGQWPWLAPIFENENTFICGSSIISKWHLLTAAHCIRNKPVENFHALLGCYNLSDATEMHCHQRSMSDVFVHRDYNETAERQKSYGDIAIFKVSIEIEYSNYIQPVCLPDQFTNVIDVIGTVAGYGISEKLSDHQNTPSHADLLSIDNHDCYNLGESYVSITSKHSFCAGSDQAVPCQGDSGGGFYVCTSNQYTIYGIVSWSINNCNIKSKVAFVDVTKYIQWINDTINGRNSENRFTDDIFEAALFELCKSIDCGEREECRVEINTPECFCQSEYNGSPPNCIPKCVSDSECLNNQSCVDESCIDSCLKYKITCAENAHCITQNHQAECKCNEGYEGDGYYTCNKMQISGSLIDQKDNNKCESDCKTHLTFKVAASASIILNTTEINPAHREENVIELLIDDRKSLKNFLPIKVNEVFPNIEIYAIFSQSLRKIYRENFMKLRYLRKLKINNNQIELKIIENSLDDLTQLTILSLKFSKIKNLPENLFRNNLKLKILELEFNELTSLDANIFQHLTELRELSLERNHLKSLSEGIFRDLHKLKDINLKGNEISVINEKIYEKCTKLTKLTMSENQLMTLSEKTFVKNVKLETIDLSGNNISMLSEKIFEHNLGLIYVDFQDNKCINAFYGEQIYEPLHQEDDMESIEDEDEIDSMEQDNRETMLEDIKENCSN